MYFVHCQLAFEENVMKVNSGVWFLVSKIDKLLKLNGWHCYFVKQIPYIYYSLIIIVKYVLRHCQSTCEEKVEITDFQIG